MEPSTNNNHKTIFVLIIVFILVVFIVFGIVLTTKKSKPPVQSNQSQVIPSQVPKTNLFNNGSLTLNLKNQSSVITVGQDTVLTITADSANKNIVGYDILISYDAAQFDFVKASSLLTEFKLTSYLRNGYLSLTGVKPRQITTPSFFQSTPIVEIILKPKNKGSVPVSLKDKIGTEVTQLVDKDVQVYHPQLNDIKIDIK